MKKSTKIILILSGLLMLAGVIASVFYPAKSFELINDISRVKEFVVGKSETSGKVLPLENSEVSLIAVGDIMTSRNVAKKIREYNDPDYPFLKVGDYLRSADIVFGNLETPITPGPVVQTGTMIFHTDPGIEESLKKANFSILSLANNHTPNYGEKGLKDTFMFLKKAGIDYVGAGKDDNEAYSPVYLESKGIKFAFLAYNDKDVVPTGYKAGKDHAGTAFMDTNRMIESIKEAKQNADFVIVSMHSGIEYKAKPSARQTDYAHAAIDSGAEMVIGHHPHVVQTVEKYKGKYVFYSLGNFIFDQMWSRETRMGLAVKIFFTKSGVERVEYDPILIEDYSQPRFAEGAEKEEVIKRLGISAD